MKKILSKCPCCNAPLSVEIPSGKAELKGCHYLVVYQVDKQNYGEAEALLIQRYGACFFPVHPGTGIVISGPHAHHIADEISLHLGKMLQSLMVFLLTSDYALKFPLEEYGLQKETESYLDPGQHGSI